MVYEHCLSMKQMAFGLFGTWLSNVNSKLPFYERSFVSVVLFFLIWLITGCALSSLISPFLSSPHQDGGKEVLSMHQILLYLLRCSKALVPEEEIANMLQWEELEWQKYAEECKGMIVTNPGTVGSSAHTLRPSHLPSGCECFRKTVTTFSKLYPWVVFKYLVDTKNPL